MWKINNKLLNNQRVKEKISKGRQKILGGKLKTKTKHNKIYEK